MTARLFPFDASAHTVVDAILPWYVNDTLAGEERQFVEDHVRVCEACQRESQWLREVYGACSAVSSLNDASLTDPVALAALQRHYGPRALKASIGDRWREAPQWTRWALAAQLAAVAVLTTLVAIDFRSEPAYRTLGVANRSVQTQAAIAVMFAPATTAAEIGRVVSAADARIVDGPTVTNAYVLEVPAARSEQAVLTLRNERAIRFAERLGTPAAR